MSLLDKLTWRIWARLERERFTPGWLGFLTNPYYFARRGLYQELSVLAPKLEGRLLDVGCGSMPYRSLTRAAEYVGLEFDFPEARRRGEADLYYHGNRFPVSDSSFDGVVCTQVLEHVFDPDEFLREIYRVMRPNALLLMTVPFMWDEHEQPYDYARYSSFGLRHILEVNGFSVLEQRKSVTDMRAVVQMANTCFASRLYFRNRVVSLFVTTAYCAPLNLLGLVLGWMPLGRSTIFLDNIVLAKHP